MTQAKSGWRSRSGHHADGRPILPEKEQLRVQGGELREREAVRGRWHLPAVSRDHPHVPTSKRSGLDPLWPQATIALRKELVPDRPLATVIALRAIAGCALYGRESRRGYGGTRATLRVTGPVSLLQLAYLIQPGCLCPGATGTPVRTLVPARDPTKRPGSAEQTRAVSSARIGAGRYAWADGRRRFLRRSLKQVSQ